MELVNWAGNVTYRASTLHSPSSIEEAQRLIATLPRVRAVGTRHSFSTIADSPSGALISLAGMNMDLEVDEESATASFLGAHSYGAVAAELDARGWALENMGSLPHISVVGGTATGTHGSGDKNGILATAIRAIELITSDGELRTIAEDDPDLEALAVGLGAFGVITRLTLAIQPSYRVRQDVYRDASWDTVLESFDEVMASAYSVCLIGRFESPAIGVTILKSVDAPGDDAALERFGGTWDPDPMPGEHHTVRAGRPGPWHERLPHFRPDFPPSVGGDELQSEYFVPRRHGVAAIETLRSMGDAIAPHLWATEIRTVAADDLWASPAFDRDSVCIGFTWKKHPEEVAALTTVVEEALEPFEPRPHWGKLFGSTDLKRRFPRLAEHLALAERYDPTGKFGSDFLTALD